MLRAIAKDDVTSQTILNTKNTLYELKQIKQTVTLKWTKAHIGIDGNELADEYAKLGATATDNIKESNIHKNYHIIIDEVAGVLKPKLSQINVFTDGSKTKHGVGAGFIVMRGKQQVVTTESISLNKEATVFQAEAVAIEKAAKFLIDHPEIRDKYIRFFSDSQAVLRALAKDDVTSQTILNTKNALYELKQIKRAVTLKWTKAHLSLIHI